MNFWQSPIGSILLNIIGGAIVSFLTWILWNELIPKYHKHNFKKVFGEDALREFYIVYGLLAVDPECIPDRNRKIFPYIKPGLPGWFHSDWVVSVTETKAANYLSEIFGIHKGRPQFHSDDKIKRESLAVSFCSLGGANNLKTMDVLKHDENIFFDFFDDYKSIATKNRDNIFYVDDEFDYGFIIKLKPKQFPGKVWIAVAGIGSLGTTGSAWYLSKKWMEIKKIAGDKSFGLITKINRKLGDESTSVIHHIIS